MSGMIDLTVAGLLEGIGEPFETFVETVSGSGTGGLDVPSTLSQAVKTKLISDLGGIHGIWKILLVGKHQQQSLSKFILVQHALQFLTCLDYTITIVAVDDENDALSVLEVMSPQWADLVLTADVPHGELNVLVFDSLDVETNCRNGRDNFTKLELV